MSGSIDFDLKDMIGPKGVFIVFFLLVFFIFAIVWISYSDVKREEEKIEEVKVETIIEFQKNAIIDKEFKYDEKVYKVIEREKNG